MEILKKIYVALIEGIKSFVPVEAKEISNDEYLIVRSQLFDLEDNTSLFQFLPGDKVLCKIELKKDYKNNDEQVLVADSLIASTVPDRNLYMLKFIIVDQGGLLRPDQINFYAKELTRLREEILFYGENKDNPYHPGLQTWAKNFIS